MSINLAISGRCPHPTRNGTHEVYVRGGLLFCRACGARGTVAMQVSDWSAVQPGDKVAKGGGYYEMAEAVLVVRRTAKYLHLENGDRIHVDQVNRDYKPWSDAEQAEVALRKRQRDLKWRAGAIEVGPSVL